MFTFALSTGLLIIVWRRVEILPKVASGWERNEEGKLATKVANLGQTMDPLKWVMPLLKAAGLKLMMMKTSGDAGGPEQQINEMANCTKFGSRQTQEHKMSTSGCRYFGKLRFPYITRLGCTQDYIHRQRNRIIL